MSNRHKTAKSIANTPSEEENYENNIQTEIITESTQDHTRVEPNTNPTENSQKNPIQIQIFSYFEIVTEKAQSPFLKMLSETI